jgi:hypothetical protein
VIRRCRAVHPRLGLQCDGEVIETTVHLEDHWATDPADQTLRHSWSDHEQDQAEWRAAIESCNGSARRSQVGGDHYRKHKIQPWDIWEDHSLGAFEGSIIKYVLRYKDKNGVEDLKKARHTLDRLIEIEEGRDGEA